MTAGNGSNGSGAAPDVDVVVVGAGVAGLYMLQRLRGLGLSGTVLEAGLDVGGTWYWNRYPGARCDVPTTDYTYSWDPQLETEWTWSEKYATQPEILKYLQHVADRHDLRRDIRFSTAVKAAAWDDATSTWTITTDGGDTVTCRWYVMATGCLSMPKEVDIAGTDRFQGDVYFTSRWPHEGVDLTGKRVGVIGTGSSGIQSIPIMAQQASEFVVFQRTPNFSIPARNGPASAERLADIAADRDAYRTAGKYSKGGVPLEAPVDTAASLPRDVQLERMEAGYASGELFGMLGVFADQAVNKEANDIVCEFLRDKIRSIVTDPETAETLCPQDHPFGTKRPCLDTGYYETFNLPHVKLVDLRKTPINTITETGIETSGERFEFDVIVFATGFDAMTGAIVGVDITGRDGTTLKDAWEHGPLTYLGLMTAGFPNLFMITGPGSPSVLSNMAVSIEQHVDWVADQIERLRAEGFERLEPTDAAQAGWVRHNNDCADITLFPTANSWYMGANVPGKPRVFLPYVGGVDVYRKTCDAVVDQGFVGFQLAGPAGEQRNEDIINQLQPDVAMVLEMMAGLELPPLESMSADEARDFMTEANAARPTGPDVGEIVDGKLPGADGDLDYRLYRPATSGPHPLVVYYHGGGWVLGSHETDDPFCRDLCVRSDMVIVSVDYRHAPEARFPAAPDDAFAALQWIAAHTQELGGIPGQLIVAGWSAGANLAAVVSQKARTAGGPEILGQLLVTPVTDCDLDTGSYRENADGYVLTKPLMEWFWDHYADPADRSDPACSPLHAGDLSGLPPAFVVTCQFDPLRDEGNAYAAALEAAGVPVTLLQARGHTHTSLSMVDVILSGAAIRAEIAAGLQQFVGASVPA
jgi:cation diffusion facilitator CzcD-associated flavoprotein CzcO/acetyl esterase/lipase